VLNIQFKLKPMMLAVTMACSYWCISGSTYAEDNVDSAFQNLDDRLIRAEIASLNPISGTKTEYHVSRKQSGQIATFDQTVLAKPVPHEVNNAIQSSRGHATNSHVSNNSSTGKTNDVINHDLNNSFMQHSSSIRDKTIENFFNQLTPTVSLPYAKQVNVTNSYQTFNSALSEVMPSDNTIKTTELMTLQPNLKNEDGSTNNELKPAESMSKEERLLQQIKAKRKTLGLTSDETLILSKDKNELTSTPNDKLNDEKEKQKSKGIKPSPALPQKHERIINRLEFNQADMLDVARALADTSGLNFVATEEAAKKKITVFLQDISVQNALETITKNAGLWYRRDKESGAYRIMTTKEYQQDLIVYREDTTRVFSMLNPNPMIIAGAIRDLYPTRVILSFGTPDMSTMGMGGGMGMGMGGGGMGGGMRGGGMGGGMRGGGMGGGMRGGGMGGGMRGGGMGMGMGGGMRGGGMGMGMGMGGAMGGGMGNNQMNENNILQENMTADQIERLSETIVEKGDASLNSEDLKGINNRQQPIFITINQEHDLMVVRTSDSEIMEEIASLVKELNRPIKQVLLEMKILSLDVGDATRRAFDLDFIPNGNTVAGPNTDQDRNPLSVGEGVRSVLGLGNFALEGGTFIYQFMNDKIRARIQMLQENNRINTLSTPILLSSNNKPAQVFVGTEQIVTTGFNAVAGVTTVAGVGAPAIIPVTEMRNIGNTLMVFPKINTDKTVTLTLFQDSSSLVRGGSTIPVPVGNSIQSFNVDSIRTSNINGTVQAKDGLTIAIGGLIDTSDREEEQSVPILSEFPILGDFFKRTVQQKSKRELLLLITPHIIETAHQGEDLSRDAIEPIMGQEW
jgi:type II secretory pathway component GspD/PulD (secretin)